MSSLWMRALLVMVIVTQCNSAQAGWFDRKKSSATQSNPMQTQNVATTVKANAPVPAQQVKQKVEAVIQKVQAVAPANVVTPAKTANPKFLDVAPAGSKWDYEKAAEDRKRGDGKVVLSKEETEKIKKEMNRLRQEVHQSKAARQAILSSKVDNKAAVIPSIPKTPTLVKAPKIQKPAVIPVTVVKPQSYKNVNAANVSGYKK